MEASLPAVEPRREPALDALDAAAPAAGQEVNREICREALEAAALLREPWLATAFDAVDREAFVPQAIWLPVRDEEGLWTFVERDEDPRPGAVRCGSRTRR
ncbi:hypothetical protein [Streptomyces sp. NPDC060031]|uniref:hypothetical protein n=1 Tax=Streptomyces sp. NPDC060031 TaxID=3347043 RepID=UPI003687C087